MTATEVVQAFETAGGCLMLDGEELRYSCPPEAAKVLEQIRQNRDAVFSALNAQARFHVEEWNLANCVRTLGTWTSVKVLWREFSFSITGRAHPLTLENLQTVLVDLGYSIEHGMIESLVLAADFLRAVELTQERTM